MKDKIKRVMLHKPNLKICDICKKETSLYSFSGHIKWAHQMTSDEYSNIYGEFRKIKIKNPNNRNIKKITCQLCNVEFSSVGLFTHLRDTHNISTDEYAYKFGEYRPNKLREIEYKNRLSIISEEEKQNCIICNSQFASGILLGYHIKNTHNITKKKYINKYIFENIHPKCKCGCGRNVKILNYHPYKVDYMSGHNKGTLGFQFSVESKLKMSKKAIDRINKGDGITINTIPELRFKSILDKFGILYEHPYEINLGNRLASVDFYLTEKNIIVEIDGEYWHPQKMENLNLYLLPNVISDKQKNVLTNMVRIRSLDLEKYELSADKEELFKVLLNNMDQVTDVILKYTQSIIKKEYFQYCLDKKGKEYLKSNSWLLLKFIRTFQPKFPYPDCEENLHEVIDKISKYDLTKTYDSIANEFSNNTSTIGHNYLKHHFKSYWNSKFNGNLSPVDAWFDDKIMKEVIDYRIGCNNSGEVFDFSLQQLVKGLSARRITVSFFKPILAASIYTHYIGDKINPIVLDPCCGFGGRLLGFKSKYPNGKYVGCEPNIETYNELQQLIKNSNWNDVIIKNCKFEDFVDENRYNYDLIFTSIPYYNLEVYSNNTEYKSFDEWKNVFIKSIEKYSGRNCYINVPEELCIKLKWDSIDSYIISNRSHFDKRIGNKKEVIVKI